MTLRPRTFELPAELSTERLAAVLRLHFRLHAEPEAACVRCYYDSFDGRLYRAGAVFYENGVAGRQQLRLERLADETPRFATPHQAAPHRPADLPTGPLRDTLAATLKLRALLPMTRVRCRQQTYRLLNDDAKTVARLLVQRAVSAEDPRTGRNAALADVVRAVPVRGYDTAFGTLVSDLGETLGLAPRAGHPFRHAAAALGQEPTQPAAYFDVRLDPQQRADEAARTTLGVLLGMMEANEPGLRQDLDTEFLHDFRVAVRRTRSLLSQLKPVFPPDVLAHFRAEFRWLGGATSATRDLDVYLLRFAAYEAWLPEATRADLAPFRVFLERRQHREHGRLLDVLDGPRYAALVRDWRAFLATAPPTQPMAPAAAQPIRRVVSARIWRIYRKIIKEGKRLLALPEVPAEALHQLRIECKKLRYLMELFASLYPRRRMRRLMRTLKKLQDNLGDFQDFEVQQHQLQRFAVEMMQEDDAPPETLLAMGRLEGHLEGLQRAAHAAYATCFRAFARRKNQQRFAALFAPAAQPPATP